MRPLLIGVTAIMAAAVVATLTAQQAAPRYRPPRLANGKPDFQGVWQVRNTANWNVQAHGGSYKTPAGYGVVVDPPDGSIPYRADALATREKNWASRDTADPLGKCYLAGVPRTMYLPYPLQILQTETEVAILSEYVHTWRWIPLTPLDRIPGYESWMGDPRGRWDGDTLVIETLGHNDQTWFDHAGNFHSDVLKVTERLTRIADDVITYEATMEDAKTFTRPWTIRLSLYRHRDMDRILENECYLYAEEAGKPIRGEHPK